MTRLFEQFIHAVHGSPKGLKKWPRLPKKTLLDHYLQAAAARSSLASSGLPIDSFTAQYLLGNGRPRPSETRAS